MAGITGFCLRCFTLDIVWGSVYPRGQGVVIGQQVIAIEHKAVCCDWDVAQGHIIIRPVVALARILANVKAQVGAICRIKWVACRFADGNVAAITTGVGHRVTNLAGKVAAVFLVHFDVVFAGCGRNVAGFTARVLYAAVAVVGRGKGDIIWRSVAVLAVVCLSVHFVAGVAVNAGHAPLAKMNIRAYVFMLAQVFIANAAAVAGGAVAGHGRCLVEVVPVNEAAADEVGLADVAFAAGSVAIVAMVAKHFADNFVVFWHGTLVKDGPIPFQIGVQVILVHCRDVRVAVAAGPFGIVARIGDEAGVGCSLIC